MNRFYPYPVLPEPVLVFVESQSLDGDRPSQNMTAAQKTIDLSRADPGWRRASFRLRVDLPAIELDAYTEIGVVVSVNCAATNMRFGTRMSREATQNSWFCDLEIETGALAKKAVMHAVVTATVDGEADRYIGESDPWNVWLTAPEIPLFSGDLEVKWIDFSSAERPGAISSDFGGLGHFIDISADPPVIYLNEGLEDLRRLFDEAPRPTAPERAIREAYFHSIAASGWLAMFNASLGAVDQDGETAFWPGNAWQRQVLETLLPRIYPDLQVESSLSRAYEDDQDPVAARILQSRALASINVMLREPQKLRRAIRLLTEEAL